jgi:hypothetical protein
VKRITLGLYLQIAALWLCVMTCVSLGQTNGPAPTSSQGEMPMQLLRDPFWPVGWAPANFGQIGVEEGGQEALAKWEEARKLLKMSGMSRTADGRYAAILKGIGVVQEGDTVSVNYGDLVYRWRVCAITSSGINTEKIGAFPLK